MNDQKICQIVGIISKKSPLSFTNTGSIFCTILVNSKVRYQRADGSYCVSDVCLDVIFWNKAALALNAILNVQDGIRISAQIKPKKHDRARVTIVGHQFEKLEPNIEIIPKTAA